MERVARLFAEELRHVISLKEEFLSDGSAEDRARWEPVEVSQILEQVNDWISK